MESIWMEFVVKQARKIPGDTAENTDEFKSKDLV
jgi:hypothetical protein